jgi:hypothetical protein
LEPIPNDPNVEGEKNVVNKSERKSAKKTKRSKQKSAKITILELIFSKLAKPRQNGLKKRETKYCYPSIPTFDPIKLMEE